MIPITIYAGRHVAVFGLGRTGLAAGESLMAGGAIVHAWDDNSKSVDKAEMTGLTSDDLYEADWHEFAALVLSPGIPLTHPEPHELVNRAEAAGVEIISDIELFVREIAEIKDEKRRPRIVAVTGTNGKSTTTALIGHILQRCGMRVHVGGNIGQAVLSLPEPNGQTVYVIEMSSYQLDITQSLGADVAILLNISPDHLERHGDMAGYVRAKERIFLGQKAGDLAVVGVDDRYTQEICTRISAGLLPSSGDVDAELQAESIPSVCPISVGKVLGRGVYAVDGLLYDGTIRPTREIVNLRAAGGLPGAHNWQNAAAAYAAARHLFRHQSDIANAILSFPGLAHRLESVGELDGVFFVNDSKATNADAASNALAAYDRIFWILGGRPKTGGIAGLERYFPKVVKAYLIGEAADDFAGVLEGQCDFEICKTLDKAVVKAGNDAQAAARAYDAEIEMAGSRNQVVLFSPACASFDQYPDFEVRGDHFRKLVNDFLTGKTSSGGGKKAASKGRKNAGN